MANGIKGITVKIGGDTTELGKALSEATTKSKALQTELKGVNTLLKSDPGNVTLLTQKFELLKQQVAETEKKQKALNEVMEKVKNGEIEMTEAEYRNLQREIESTKIKQKSLKDELKDFGSVGAQVIAEVGEKMKKVGKEVEDVGKKFMPLSGALIAVGGASIKEASDFDSAMSQVGATMGMTVEEINNGSETFQKLRDSARESGATTAWSAVESAEALNYMALAGYDANTAIEVLPSVLNLATSGNMELAQASDMVTDALTALGKESDFASTLVDQMAYTSSKSNTSVSQLGEAILKIGGTAKLLSGGTTELNTALGILADNSIKGAEGGTHLRNILLALNPTTDKAKAAWKELGISAYDADGKMRPLQDTFADLNQALDGYTDQERIDLLSGMFNKTDLSSVNALLGTQSERWEELSGGIDNASGSAQNMADVQLNNLNGQMTLLKSALSEAMISIGDALMPIISALVEKINDWVNWFNSLDESTQTIIVVIGGLLASIGPVLIIVGKVISAIGTILTVVPHVVTFIGTIKTGLTALWGIISANPLGAIIVAITAVVTALIYLYNHCDAFREWVDKAIKLITDIGKAFINLVVNWFTKEIPDGVKRLKDEVVGKWNEIKTNVSNTVNTVKETVTNVFNNIKNYMINAITGAKDKVGSLFTGILDNIKNVFKNVKNIFSDIGKNVIEGIKNGITGAVSGLYNSIKGALGGLVDKAKNALGIHSPSRVFRDAIGAMIPPGIAQGIQDEASVATDAIDDLTKDLTDQELALGGVSIARNVSVDPTSTNVGTTSPIDRIMAQLEAIEAKMDRMEIVLDTGETVGGLVDPMDEANSLKNDKLERGW